MTKVDRDAKIIWDYMHMNHELEKSDLILLLGSIDERVPAYAAELYKKGYGKKLLISGGAAHQNDLLATNWEAETEAEHFAQIVVSKGVSEENIILETKATNTGENIQFSQKLLKEMGINVSSIIIVQKPFMERRSYATFMKQWVGSPKIIITSPQIDYNNYFNESNSKEKVLNTMVGDLQRIKEYPKLGFQIEQDIPPNVWEAWEGLVEAGYNKHLV